MAYEVVESNSSGRFLKLGGVDKETGEKFPISVEGYYKGPKEITTKKGTSTIHLFETKEGEKVIWGALDMDSKLQKVQPGTMTSVTFTGKVQTKNGNTMNSFEVKQDPKNVVDLAIFSTEEESDEEVEADVLLAEASKADRLARAKQLLAKTRTVKN
jgi:hypothetical protein